MTDAPIETTPPTTAAPKRSIARFVTPVLALVAALGVGIFGGVLIGQNTASASTPTGFTPPEGMDLGRPGGNATSGEITAVDGDVVTLTLDDGTTVTVTTSSDTTVTVDGALGDLAAGDTVTVLGETDDEGNVTATSISEGTGGFGGGAPPTDQG
jgi:hypothetical protein